MYNKNNQKICAFCAWCDIYSDNTALCYYYGPTKKEGKCRKFRYDPYKRIPANERDIKKVSLKPIK